jgi:hypothetical protein
MEEINVINIIKIDIIAVKCNSQACISMFIIITLKNKFINIK